MIAVYGATGTTGAMVVRELLDRGADVVVAGRDRGKLEALAASLDGTPVVAVAAVDDARALAAAFGGARVVVSCAGPFTAIGEPVLEAAIAAGAHYLDSSGEQGFLRAMYERHEAEARRAGVAAIPGMGLEVAIGDLAAGWAAARITGASPGDDLLRAEQTCLAEDDPLDEVAVAYLLEHFVPTAGTQRSAIAQLGAPGVVWRVDRWDAVAPGAERRRVNGGAEHGGERDVVSFPSGEVITVPRHVAARRVQTFVSLTRNRWMSRAAGLLAPALPLLARTRLPGRLATMVDEIGPDARTRAEASFAIVATARRRFDHAQVTVGGRDVYATTATILAWAATRLATREHGPTGVLAPSEVFAPRPALEAIRDEAALTTVTSF